MILQCLNPLLRNLKLQSPILRQDNQTNPVMKLQKKLTLFKFN
jgi:hypothetical protein